MESLYHPIDNRLKYDILFLAGSTSVSIVRALYVGRGTSSQSKRGKREKTMCDLKIKAMGTREVAKKIGKSVRRTQELITAGVIPGIRVQENGRTLLGVRPEVVKSYLQSQAR